jgi:outer membrane protein assembly factor BamB
MKIKFKNALLIFFSISVLLISCKVEEFTSPPKQLARISLDTVWTKIINGYSNNPILNSNSDILMSRVVYASQNEVFKLFDGKTGQLKWEWQDYYAIEEDFSYNKHLVFHDIVVLCARSNTYAFDMVTGKTVWKNSFIDMVGEPQIFAGKNEYAYQGYRNKIPDYQCHIYRTKYDKGNWEKVCTYEDSTKQFDVIYSSPIAFSNNSSGDELMVFTLFLYSSKNLDLHASKVCCFNLSTNQYEWIKDYSNKYYEFMVCKMQSNKGKVFTFATTGNNRFLVAINCIDGSIAWEQSIPDLGVGLHLYKDNIIPICNGKSPLTAYNQNTGAIVWSQNFENQGLTDLNFAIGDAIIYKNYLISTQGDNLLVVNMDGGGVLYKEKIALPQGYLQFGVAINEKERLLYVQDRLRVVCYKLPDEIK